MSEFSPLGLPETLLRALNECGYQTPTPIQAQAIPVVLAGGDLLAAAQTGTGKTAAFMLPILARLSATPRPANRPIRALILSPTRELAAQIEQSVRDYGRHTQQNSLVVFGGVSINPQIDRLRRGVDILIATPGRLLDLAGQRALSLSHVETLVLDEADRMLDMGFIRDIRRVLTLLPPKRQNLLFSATFPAEITALANSLLHKPTKIEVARNGASPTEISQRVCMVDKSQKRDLLIHLIKDGNWFQVLVFVRTKHNANRLAESLDKAGIPSLAIHGNKSQNARTKALAEFKAGTLQVLVATDIAARGIDISELPHVVNFELPHVPEDYVHRIGRTGRAGSTGEAHALVGNDEQAQLNAIERLLGAKIPRFTVTGFDQRPRANAEPQHAPERRQHAPARAPARHPNAQRPGGNGQRRAPRVANGNRQSPRSNQPR
jgi:ATP-dependent RNA helicase RhlE